MTPRNGKTALVTGASRENGRTVSLRRISGVNAADSISPTPMPRHTASINAGEAVIPTVLCTSAFSRWNGVFVQREPRLICYAAAAA